MIYGEEKTANKKPAIVQNTLSVDSDFKLALLAVSASPSTTSYSLLRNVTITKGKTNPLATTLIPLTIDVIKASFSQDTISFRLPDTKGQTARRFIMIDLAAIGIPALNTLKKITLSIRNSGIAESKFLRLDVYKTDGTIHTSNQTEVKTLASGVSSEIWPVAFKESSQFFLYVEYAGNDMYLDLDYTFAITIMAASSDGSVRTSVDGVNWKGPYLTGLTTCNALVYGGSGLFVVAGVGADRMP